MIISLHDTEPDVVSAWMQRLARYENVVVTHGNILGSGLRFQALASHRMNPHTPRVTNANADTRRERIRAAVRVIAAAAMVAIGVAHFANPEPFLRIVPAILPAKRALVFVSGAFEIAGGLGLLVPFTRKLAGWGLIALYVAVFPANINMAVNQIQIGEHPLPAWIPWARLPFQVLFIAIAWWVSREPARVTKGE